MAPRLHSNLSEVCREKVARLRYALALPPAAPEVPEAVRAPIDPVEVYPPAAGSAGRRIELQGHLASMLRLAGAFRP